MTCSHETQLRQNNSQTTLLGCRKGNGICIQEILKNGKVFLVFTQSKKLTVALCKSLSNEKHIILQVRMQLGKPFLCKSADEIIKHYLSTQKPIRFTHKLLY